MVCVSRSVILFFRSCSLRFFVAKIVVSDLVVSDTYFSATFSKLLIVKVIDTFSHMNICFPECGKKKGKKKRDSVIDTAKNCHIPPAVMLLQCYVCLTEGLSLILAAVRNELNVFQLASPFNTEHSLSFSPQPMRSMEYSLGGCYPPWNCTIRLRQGVYIVHPIFSAQHTKSYPFLLFSLKFWVEKFGLLDV